MNNNKEKGMLKEQINSKKQGDVGMGAAIAYFCKCGHTVSIPITDSQDYDLIVDIDNKLCRVQCKTTYHIGKYGIYKANLKVFGGNKSRQIDKRFDNTKVEYIFILCESTEMYLIPSNELKATTSISLGKLYTKYKVN